jgi:hypothetical protein
MVFMRRIALVKSFVLATGLAVALSLTGCVTSHVLLGAQRPPIQPTEVQVYLQPPAEYQQIALLQSSSRAAIAIGAQAKTDKLMERLKREAASLGANGIILQGLGDQAGGAIELNSTQISNSGKSGFGVGSAISADNKVGTAVAIFVPAGGS